MDVYVCCVWEKEGERVRDRGEENAKIQWPLDCLHTIYGIAAAGRKIQHSEPNRDMTTSINYRLDAMKQSANIYLCTKLYFDIFDGVSAVILLTSSERSTE